jgi:hypothetical protein
MRHNNIKVDKKRPDMMIRQEFKAESGRPG